MLLHITILRFIGRIFELKELEEEYEKGTFSLSVIYGRRRVGITYLIKEFLKRKKGYILWHWNLIRFQTFYCILKRINLYFIYADIVHR